MRPTDKNHGLDADTSASSPPSGQLGQHGGGGHQTYDREIDLRAILKWMGVLLIVTVVCHVLVWWLIEGFEWVDAKGDPALTPIQQANPQQLPPHPRLQTAPGFAGNNPEAWAKSDLEDMMDLRAEESKVLDQPAWINQGEGRLRVPINVAMEVIASRGNQGLGVGAAGTVTPQEMREQLPAGTSPGAPGATVQMSRPDTPAQATQANEQQSGAAEGQQPQQQTPRPPVSQEQ